MEAIAMRHLIHSGGSRISPRWGANSPGGLQHTILPDVPKNCINFKEFGSGRGGVECPSRPLRSATEQTTLISID